MTAPFASVLDHLVFAGPDLQVAVERVAALTGVTAAPGGTHPIGTANALITFTVGGERGRHYLEIIGPDPARGVPASEIPTFGIDSLTEPRLATYAVHPDRIEDVVARAREAGLDLGDAAPLSRATADGRELHWRLTPSPPAERRPLVPFLIDWGSTAHPALGELPTLELLAVRGEHPEPGRVAAQLALLGVELDISPAGTPALIATVAGPAGTAELR